MGCAPVTEILVKEGQMEAVESLIGDGEGGTGGGLGPGSWWAGGWSSKGSRREAREWWCFLLLLLGWRELGAGSEW
jgi:hypothetical protein